MSTANRKGEYATFSGMGLNFMEADIDLMLMCLLRSLDLFSDINNDCHTQGKGVMRKRSEGEEEGKKKAKGKRRGKRKGRKRRGKDNWEIEGRTGEHEDGEERRWRREGMGKRGDVEEGRGVVYLVFRFFIKEKDITKRFHSNI